MIYTFKSLYSVTFQSSDNSSDSSPEGEIVSILCIDPEEYLTQQEKVKEQQEKARRVPEETGSSGVSVETPIYLTYIIPSLTLLMPVFITLMSLVNQIFLKCYFIYINNNTF